MDQTESSNSTPDSGQQDLTQQVMALQRQVFLLLVLLIMVTATVVFYLACQSVVSSKDYAAMRPAAVQVIQQYGQNATVIQNFEKQLVDFGTTHPPFQPILVKYGLMRPASAPAVPAQ